MANWVADWSSASGMRTRSRHDGTRLVGEGGMGEEKKEHAQRLQYIPIEDVAGQDWMTGRLSVLILNLG